MFAALWQATNIFHVSAVWVGGEAGIREQPVSVMLTHNYVHVVSSL